MISEIASCMPTRETVSSAGRENGIFNSISHFYLSNFFNFYYERDRNLLFPMRAYDIEGDGTVVGKIAAVAFSHNKYDGN